MTSMSQSVNRKISIFVLLCLLLLITVALLFYFGLPELNHLKRIIVSDLHNSYLKARHNIKSEILSYNMESSEFWKNIDLKKDEIPLNKIEFSSKIPVSSNKISIEDSEIFYREVNPENANKQMTVLLLHGMAFSSKTWYDLGTIQILSALDYRTIAIDLPGFGQSTKGSQTSFGSKFLRTLIEKLDLKKPVIISPSYSGYYSIPYLLEYWNEMAGYVPVSPVGDQVIPNYQCLSKDNTESTQRSLSHIPEKLKIYIKEPFPNLDCLKTPSMIVYGENDKNVIGLKNSAILGLMPFSQIVVIPNGSHPAYLSDKDLWHKLLFNFLNLISEKEKS